MLSQTDAVKQAWAATDRTLDIIVTVDGKDYQATEINSLSYDAGAFTGDTLGIGSTYENSVTIEFSSVVEAFKQGLTVLPKIGVLVNGKFEYTSLGTFIVSEVNRDRNNDLTTIKALDQMCKLEGQYKPTVSDMASPLDIIADIANQGGVTVNTGELQHLPTLPNIKKIEGQTLRTAIGWVAQLYDGFATFDRDGKLTIRTIVTPDYTITPGEYQQGGLTKNEVAYKTGGIKVTVNTKKTDDSGQEVDDTTTLQVGETTGSQIELTNDSMTSDLLTTVWTGIKDITYYPYTLNWFGNPGIEAGDWVTLTDTQGNRFNVPINQYTMSFNGGLESTISATQTSSAAGGYAYTGSAGSIKNMIEALQVRHTASGNNVYPPSYQGQPKNPKKGDVWYKQNGNNVEMWIYQETDGKSTWVKTPLDGEVKAELQAMGKKTDEDLTRVKSELSSAAESQWQSMKAATSEVANDLNSAKARLAAVSNDLSATKADLADTRNSLATTANDLSATKNSLEETRTSLADTRDSLATTTSDLSTTKASLEETRTSLATATSEFQRQTGQLSGSLSTANAKIEFNSNAIAEVKHTAEEISTTVSNIRVGGRNLLTNTRTLSDAWNGTTETVDGFTVAKATQTNSGAYDPIQWYNLVVKSNTDYVLTFYAKASKQTTIYSYLYDIGNSDGSTPNTLTTDYQRYTVHFHTNDIPTGRTVNCLPVRLYESGVTAWIYGVQLEEGNTATQWQPNPNDTDQAISKVSQTADAIRADLTNTQDDVASVKVTANSLQSQITDNKNNISAVKQTADSLTSTVGQMPAQWQQAINDKASAQELYSNVDMNNLTTAGTYLIKDFSAKNTPIGAWFMATVEATADHTRVVQRVKRDDSNVAYERSNYYKGWTAWERVATGTDVSSIKQTMDSITTRVSNAEGNVSGLQQTASKLQSDLTNAKGDISSLQQTANGLTSRVGSAEGNISSLQQTATGIQSTVQSQSGKISQLQQDADGLSATVGGAAIDLISNLDQPFIMGWGIPNTTWDGHNACVTLPTTSIVNEVLPQDGTKFATFYNWEAGKTYMQSIIFETDAKVTDGMLWTWYTTNGHVLEKTTLVKLGNNTYRLIGSHTPTASEAANPLRVFDIMNFTAVVDVTTGTYLKFRNPRIWCPDDNSLAQLKLTTDSLTSKVADTQGNVSKLEQTASGLNIQVSNAEDNISQLQLTAKKLQATVGDDNTGLVSYVKAIPGQISSAITASKQATVITSAVDVHNMTTAGYYLLKGTLTNSPVEAWAFLRVITSDSGDRIYHKIWKDDSSTVYTEEWTGEWSGWATHINSENLKSNVITAINQSTEGVSITGSKITLDGNVNVTPGFTLSADNIKAGKLSADLISGGTLDLSGNITTVKGLTANSISSGSISGQNLNINLDNGVVEFTKGNLHSTDGGFNISIDTKSFYLDMGNNSKLWINGNGFHLQESATQHLWMNKDGLHNYTDANGNGLWINDTTLKVLNSNGEGLVAKNGLLQFSTLPTWLNFGVNSTLTAQAYGIIGPDKNLFGSKNGLFVKGREGVVIGTNSYNGETFLGSLFNANSLSGSGISLSDDMTKAALFFTKAPLILAGGPTWDDSNKMPVKPYISVGSDWYYSHSGPDMVQRGEGTYTRGNNIIVSSRNTNIIGYDWINFKSNGRIALDADYVHSYPTYLNTTSAGANVYVARDGALVRSSSARKYKTDIQDANNAYGEKLIEFAPKKWIDKAEKKRYEEDPENNKKPGYYYGLIADDLDAAGLDMLVNYGAEGQVEGINYDRLAVALLPVIKSLKDQVASLKEQLKALTK